MEFTTLEIRLGELLGSLLHVDKENGKIIYLTPHTGFGRISIIENLISDGKNLYRKGTASHRHLVKLMKRARALMSKRHEIIHHSWGTASNGRETVVARRSTPFLEKQPFIPVAVEDLKRIIADIRNLTNDVHAQAEANYRSWPPYTSQPILTKPTRRGRTGISGSPQKDSAQEPAPQPRSLLGPVE